MNISSSSSGSPRSGAPAQQDAQAQAQTTNLPQLAGPSSLTAQGTNMPTRQPARRDEPASPTLRWYRRTSAGGIDAPAAPAIPSGPKNQAEPLLFKLIRERNYPEMRHHLETGDPNVSLPNGATPLMAAAKRSKHRAIHLLLAHPDLDINAHTTSGLTALHAAAAMGDLAALTMIANAPGININARKNGDASSTALHMVALAGDVEKAEVLLRIPQTDINAITRQDSSALHLAVMREHLPVVEALLRRPGIAVNSHMDASAKRVTPLHIAAMNGQTAMVQGLINAPGIDLRAVCDGQLNALHIAARAGHASISERLLDADSQLLDTRTDEGMTALMLASISGNTNVMDSLLARPGIDINAVNGTQRSALLLAVANTKSQAVTKLLAVPGVDVNLTDIEGNTALSVASRNGNLTILVDMLLHPGIDINAPVTEDAQTVLHAAVQRDDVRVVQVLMSAPSINLNAEGNGGITPLHLAAHFSPRSLAVLINHGSARINHPTETGATALHFAALVGSVDATMHLLRMPDIDPGLRMDDDLTALDVARSHHHTAIEELLQETMGGGDESENVRPNR